MWVDTRLQFDKNPGSAVVVILYRRLNMTNVMKWQMTYLTRIIMTKTFQTLTPKRRENMGTIAYEVGENIWNSTRGQGVADDIQ